MQVGSLGQEDLLEEEMAIHSSVLAWRVPWTEEPGGLKSMGLQRIILVLPVPPRESPKGEEEGNIQSSGFSDSICSSTAWGADLKLSEGMACQRPL